MALERAVFCLILLHCLWARDTFSIDKLTDIVTRKVDLKTDEIDDHFWEDEYWKVPYQQDLECPEDYGWVGDFLGGTCQPCKEGTESSSGHWKTQSSSGHWKLRCKPCKAGYFNDAVIGGYCEACPDYFNRATTFKLGAQDAEECVDPEEIFGDSSYQSEVSIEVQLSGDWSWAQDMLWQLSGLNVYEMRAHVSYDETDDISIAKARAMLPNYLAMHTYQNLLEFKRYVSEVNDYASLAHHYAELIFKMLDHSELLSLLGFQMNYYELDLKNIEVLSTTIHLQQDCLDGYYSVDWDGVGTRCVTDNKSSSKEKRGEFMMYQGNSEFCKSLGGEAKLREFVEKSWPFPCLKDNQCNVYLPTSKEISSEQCAIVVYISTDNPDINFADQVSSAGDVETEETERGDITTFVYVKNSLDINCEGSPTIDTDSTFQCESCDPLEGYYLTKSGNCEKCPFGTWIPGDSTAKTCKSCPFDRPGTVYGVVPDSKDKCINSGMYTWENGRKGEGFDMKNNQTFDLNVNAEVNMCEVAKIKNNFKSYCSQKYDMDDISFEDITDFERLSCTVMSRLSEIYEKSCQNSKYGMSDIIDNFPNELDLEGTACFAAKSLYYIEENAEKSDCETLNSQDRNMQMPVELSYDADVMWFGGLVMPLVSKADKLVNFDFNAVSGMIEAIMRKTGIYDMAKLTGLEMMDYVRDVIIEIPRGLTVKEGSFKVKPESKDLFCGNENAELKCSCRTKFCPTFDYDNGGEEPTCTADGCDGCKEIWTLNNSPYDCSDSCATLNNFDNGILIREFFYVYQDAKSFFDQHCPRCLAYMGAYNYACDKNYRFKNKVAKCNSQNAFEDFRSITLCFYENANTFRLSSMPECIIDNCKYPKLENGYLMKKGAYATSYCRAAQYRCDVGYTMEGPHTVDCFEDDTFSEMPRCVKTDTCEFNEGVDKARFVMEYLSSEENSNNEVVWTRKGWYQCQNGYRFDQDHLYQSVSCGDEVSCEDTLYKCPGVVNGYLVREWKVDDASGRYYEGEYICNQGFMLMNTDLYTSDSNDNVGWGRCGYNGKDDLPSCVPDGTPVPCNMPEQTRNGYLVKEVENKDGMVTFGQYSCNAGHTMVETWKGDGMGWCRADGSFELPYCMTSNEYFAMEFHIEESGFRMENAGFVKARKVHANSDKDKWEAGCDDRFNDFAAGAMCRQMGFQHGKQVTMKKMPMMVDMEYGWTNIHCKYDDTLIMSDNCNADRYGIEGQAVCTPYERIAVRCFDTFWDVSAEFQFVERNRKMFCPVEIIKEGDKLKIKKMGLRVEWGGVTVTGDEKQITTLQENIDYTSRGFSVKKGFRAKYTGKTREYDCFCCKIFMGDTLLHTEYEKNHKCDK